MNTNTFYYIHGIRPYQECYYTPGIMIENIPFSSFQHIRLEKKTIVGSRQYTHDFLPKFRKYLRKWFRWIRSTRSLLRRELEGPLRPQRYDI
jgi:hypothetical protein